ncbi:MAG TPA: hypothetical protein VFL12_02400 [Thermoanaerobaculia bacterium]|nr:hypothetical protein [Thermoanaerobaculia bacterium]
MQHRREGEPKPAGDRRSGVDRRRVSRAGSTDRRSGQDRRKQQTPGSPKRRATD